MSTELQQTAITVVRMSVHTVESFIGLVEVSDPCEHRAVTMLLCTHSNRVLNSLRSANPVHTEW